MALFIFNSLTSGKEAFVPRVDGKVGIYVCGPTVYDMSHIGHARAYVAFDTVVRYLRRRYEVTYVRNFTDVDDKIIKRAAEVGSPCEEISEQFITEFYTDMDALGVLRADIEPKVTEHITEVVALNTLLCERGLAYQSGNDLYYDVAKFNGYGKLSKRKLEDMEAGARVEVNTSKRCPFDFVLWKAAKEGEPAWSSPWGKGRPGWHIECSAMGQRYLGETFDIHGGGKDLIFPHHENEIAQSEGATGKTYANWWMHNGFINVDNQKMSKSLGNFFTIRDLLKLYDPQTLRYYLLTTHYRSPINFSDQALADAETRVTYLYQTLARMDEALLHEETAHTEETKLRTPTTTQLINLFEESMDDDFNTAKALGDLSDLFKLINEIIDQPSDSLSDRASLQHIKSAITEISSVLGLFCESPKLVLERMKNTQGERLDIDPKVVEQLLANRLAARKSKNFTKADQIRDQLVSMGVVIKDGREGTSWSLA